MDTPNLPVGGSVTYAFTVTVPAERTGDLVNTVTVDLPEGFNDPTPNNNTATDVDEGPEPVPTLPFVVLLVLIASLTAGALRSLRRARE